MSAHPPWAGRAAAPEGQQIRRTRYGAFVQREDGAWVPWYPHEEEIERLLRSSSPRPPPPDWNPLDD
jgi:hypothetical protein